MEINEQTMSMQKQLFSVLIFFIGLNTVHAADFEREKRLQEQTLATLFTGEPIYLTDTETEFLALETEAEGDSKGTVILLHGRGYGPDSEIVVGPVREALSEYGWHTLSVQMPVLEKGAKYYDYVKVFPEARLRINAALDYLKAADQSPVILLAHSCGVHMSMDWLRTNGDGDIDAFIGLGMGATDYKQPMLEPLPFEKMSIPILDLFGDADYPAVVSKAQQRLDQYSGVNTKSQQIIISQANHEFEGHNDELIESISNWLDTL